MDATQSKAYRRSLSALLLTAVVAAGACSAAPSRAAPVVVLQSAEAAFNAEVTALVCAAGASCCLSTNSSWNQDACAGMQSAGTFILWSPGVDDRGLDQSASFDAEQAAACVAALRSLTSEASPLTSLGASCAPDPGALAAALDVCQQVYVGTATAGAFCQAATDCAAVPTTIRDCYDGSCEYTPQTTTSEEGEPCDPSPVIGQLYRVCDQSNSLWCDASTSICQSPVANGAPCDESSSAAMCGQGSACIASAGGAVCASAGGLGDTCGGVCVGSASCTCGAGTYCDTQFTNQCVLAPTSSMPDAAPLWGAYCNNNY
jgi:hypothetical protein